MTIYATRAAALDRFLAEHSIDPEDVIGVTMNKYAPGDTDVRVHIYTKVPGLAYQPTLPGSRHSHADVEWEELTIRVVHFEKAAAA